MTLKIFTMYAWLALFFCVFTSLIGCSTRPDRSTPIVKEYILDPDLKLLLAEEASGDIDIDACKRDDNPLRLSCYVLMEDNLKAIKKYIEEVEEKCR